MKIMIDISKDRYDEIMSMDWNNCRRFFDEEIRAIHDGKPIDQEPCEMTAEEYRQRMIQAFHNADCGELIALVVLPTEKEFEHLEWLLEKHYKAKPEPNRCNQCKYYEGVHNVQGHAPCSFLKCGGVLWDWYCSNYEPTGAEGSDKYENR